MFSLQPYLITNVLTLILLFLASKKLLNSKQHTLVILGGLTNLPCFAFTVLFEGVYWAPIRLGGWSLGIEDAICTYDVGAMAWFAAVLFFPPISRETITFFDGFKRYCIVAGSSGIVFFACYFLKVDVMTSFLLMCATVGTVFFIRLRPLRKLALAGLWKLPLVYLIIVKIYFLIWPDFVLQWNLSSFWGQLYFGLPLGEIAWAMGFGFYWPLFMGYVFKLRIEEK